MAGNLYLVTTPIGNLDDLTYRAIKTLQEVDLVCAEDTRRTGALLSHLEIKKPLISYHEHSDNKKHSLVLDKLLQGLNIALCSDAGMPCIADPGQKLVKDALDLNIQVIPIPGVNAFLTALIASGISSDCFTFYGFFPRKNKNDEVNRLKQVFNTSLYYESPQRILDTVKEIAQVFPNRQIVVARELTKIHEEFIRGCANDVYQNLLQRQNIKGEIVLIIEPEEIIEKEYSDQEIIDLLKNLFDNGSSKKDAIKNVTNQYNIAKNRVYELSKQI